MQGKKLAVLVGGSDLFSGVRGISKGTILIKKGIAPGYHGVLAVNYNYFLDFGRALRSVQRFIDRAGAIASLSLYGYSKGGDVVLQLARWLQNKMPVDLLVTIDMANGPWSDQIDRSIPGNVKKTINVFQRTPNILRSHGAPAHSPGQTEIVNIDLTGKRIAGQVVGHSNIERLMVEEVIGWMNAQAVGQE